jgi:hypothetical protein
VDLLLWRCPRRRQPPEPMSSCTEAAPGSPS